MVVGVAVGVVVVVEVVVGVMVVVVVVMIMMMMMMMMPRSGVVSIQELWHQGSYKRRRSSSQIIAPICKTLVYHTITAYLKHHFLYIIMKIHIWGYESVPQLYIFIILFGSCCIFGNCMVSNSL